MFDLTHISIIIIIFLIAGTVKGIVGLGLPTVSLGLLSLFFEIPMAIVLMLLPSAITNLWQALAGGRLLEIVKRNPIFFAAAFGFIFLGAKFAADLNGKHLVALLGALLVLYSASGIAGFRLLLKFGNKIHGFVFGAVNGVLTGLTGSFTVPGVLFLQSAGLEKNDLVQAMGILFFGSTVFLAAAVGTTNGLRLDLLTWSAVAILPAILGMYGGGKIREIISEETFRHLLFGALMILGIYLMVINLI